MRSATRRGLTAAIALLTALVAALWVAAPAQAHEGVNVTLQTDGSGGVWGVVTYADGHAVTGPITAVFLAASPDGAERVGPIALRAEEGQTDGVVRYGGVLEPGQWQVTFDVASPGIASCSMSLTAVAAGSVAPSPQQQVCAASFWPTASADVESGGGSSLIVAVLVIGAVLLAVALFIAVRARRDRPGGGPRGKGGPSGPRERTGAGRSRSR
jgi:hypothetical protein